MTEHLDHAGQIKVREVAAQRRLRVGEHLRGLEAFCVALKECAHVSGDVFGAEAAIDVVVASGAECFHQRLVSAFAHGDDGDVRGLRVSIQDLGQLVGAHLAEICGTEDRDRRVPLERGQRKGGLRVVHYVKADRAESVTQALGEEHVAVDQEQARIGAVGHYAASVNASLSRSMTSMVSSGNARTPRTYFGSAAMLGAIMVHFFNSHSPVTGTA